MNKGIVWGWQEVSITFFNEEHPNSAYTAKALFENSDEAIGFIVFVFISYFLAPFRSFEMNNTTLH